MVDTFSNKIIGFTLFRNINRIKRCRTDKSFILIYELIIKWSTLEK